MRQSKVSFRHHSLQNTKSIQEFLKSVAKGIDKGRLTFSDDDGEIVMEPKDLLTLKMTASQDETLNRFNIRISWQSEEEKPREQKKLTVKSGKGKGK